MSSHCDFIRRTEVGKPRDAETTERRLAQRFAVVGDKPPGDLDVDTAAFALLALERLGRGRASAQIVDDAIVEGVRFYMRQKSVMQRWPESTESGPEFAMPTAR